MVIATSARLKRVPEYSVRRISAFSSLPGSVIQRLDSLLSPCPRAAGEILYTQNETPAGLYILFHGKVKLTAVVAAGKTALLRISNASDLLGLNAVIAERPHVATARALKDCRLAFLARESLSTLMVRHSELALVVAKRLAEDCADALTEMLFLRATTSSTQRLAMLLLRWSGRGRVPNGRVPLLYTQAEIGQMIGASRETVTRLFNRLEREGDISVSHSKLEILDQQAMRKIALMC